MSKLNRNNKFLIAGGNPTLVVEGCPRNRRTQVALKALKDVDQVGFVDTLDNLPCLQMMGGELCINATIAFASMLGAAGRMRTSGLDAVIVYKNSKVKVTTLEFTMKWQQVGTDVVLLSGIGFVFVEGNKGVSKERLRDYCELYKLPAFGAIKLKKNAITPLVYVVETDSLVEESACGSGSIAACIWSNVKHMGVIQPTGQVIEVGLLNDNRISIGAHAVAV